jgi:3-dehydroquinate synthase
MARVEIELPHHRYEVIIEPGVLANLGGITASLARHARCALFGDANVLALHGAAARASLEAADYEVVVGEIAPGESNKTLASIERIYDVLLDARLERGSPLIALGGGVTGDMVGFAAATYLRGVPFVQCPTTLLAMVDSSVGGKTGVNVAQGKNLIGAFYQPVAVVADPWVLGSLPVRELRCGLAECIKHGVIRDESLFEFIEQNVGVFLSAAEDTASATAAADTMAELVRRNVEIKASVVIEDEKERGVRAHLNFGHTFAHAIEATAGYGEIQHGEAVALGMRAATRVAAELGICDASVQGRLSDLCEAGGLPTRIELASDDVLQGAMRHDKKVVGSRVRFVLPTRIGEVVLRDDVPPECITAGWAEIRS